jgi:hypothetical protein
MASLSIAAKMPGGPRTHHSPPGGAARSKNTGRQWFAAGVSGLLHGATWRPRGNPSFGLCDDQGRLEAAALEAEQAYRITGDLPFVLGTLGRYYGLAGHRTQAVSALARLKELGRQQHVERVYLAEALIGVDDRPGALDALEESARSREPDLPWKLSYGHLDRLRGEPRYGALLKRVGVSVHRR